MIRLSDRGCSALLLVDAADTGSLPTGRYLQRSTTAQSAQRLPTVTCTLGWARCVRGLRGARYLRCDVAIDVRLDNETQARVIDSLVLRGDISLLNPQDRARYYIEYCQQLGLNPASNPLAILKLNGKEVLYPTRGATDQLAAIHRLNREVIEGPELRKFGNVELLYCKVRVSHPNGRVETALATLPGRVDDNALMKLETKAKRRGTLSILGLGLLDETEIESIPASAKELAPQVDVRVVETQPTPSLVEKYREALQAMSGASMWDLVFLWNEWAKDLREEVDSEALHDLQMEAKGAATDATSMQAWKWACEVVAASIECPLVLESLKVHRSGEVAPDFIFSWQEKKTAIAALKPEYAKLCWELHWRGYGRVTGAAKPQEAFKKALDPNPEGPKGKKTAPQAAPANAEGSSAEAAPAVGAQASVSYLVPLTESARFVASADEWRAHVAAYKHRENAINSWKKHCAAFRSAGDKLYRDRLQTAAERFQALANAVDVEVCKVALLNAEREANNNARKHAEALRKAG